MILFRSPLILIAKTIVCAILAKYKHGQLRITYSEKGSINGADSKNLVFGSGLPCTEVFVVDEWFWVRILLSGSKVKFPPPWMSLAICDTANFV